MILCLMEMLTVIDTRREVLQSILAVTADYIYLGHHSGDLLTETFHISHLRIIEIIVLMDLEGISKSDRLTLLGLLLSLFSERCLIKDSSSLNLHSRNLVLTCNLHKHRLERELIEKQGTTRLGIKLECTVHHRTFLTESTFRRITVLIHYLCPVILIFSGSDSLEHKDLNT